MLILDITEFCTKSSPIWQFIGYIIFIFKIAIPILLILFGMIDLGKAVVASDDGAIKKSTSSLIKRTIAAVVIFFIPWLVDSIFEVVVGYDDVKDVYAGCERCVLKPNGSDCSSAVSTAKAGN